MEDELNSQEEPFGATFSRLMDINCTISVEEEQSQANTLFEAACSERIQLFDDSESDEEELKKPTRFMAPYAINSYTLTCVFTAADSLSHSSIPANSGAAGVLRHHSYRSGQPQPSF